MMRFYNKEKRRNDIKNLSDALSKRDNTPINVGSVAYLPSNNQQEQSTLSGANDLLNGGMNLYNGLKDSGLFDKNTGDLGDTLVGGNYFGSGSTGSMTMDNVLGNTGTGSMTFDNLGSAGGGFSGMPLIGNALNAGGTALNGGSWKTDVPQSFFGIDKNDSDVMQGIKGTINGASTGASVGGAPGAIVGALLGLGTSFADDIHI